MNYTVDTTIAGPSAGNPNTITAWAKSAGAKRPDDVAFYIKEVYRLCAIAGLRAEVIVAQAIHECSDATTGAPFASSWWVNRCNPAGIGITGDPTQDAASTDFGNGTNAARAHVVHLYLYAVGETLPSGMDAVWDPRWAAAISAGNVGIAKTIQGLQNTWGIDNNYANALLGRLIALSNVMGTGNGGTTVAGFKLYTFPGLKKQVPIPDWINVIIANPLPDGPNLTNHTPSSAFTKTTWHDTGNDTTNAADEYAWLKAGRPGGEPGDYSGIFDDTTIYITSRFDEDVWHAGTPAGNHTSYGFEQAYGGNVDFSQSLKVGAALHGGLCAALGWDVATALVPHQFWYGKYCPRQILDKGIWPQVVQMTNDAAAAAAAFLGGVLPPSAYAAKHPLPPKTVVGANATVYWYSPQTRTTTTAATPREYADPAAAATGATIPIGTAVDLSHICIGADAALWVVGTGGSRLPTTAFV